MRLSQNVALLLSSGRPAFSEKAMAPHSSTLAWKVHGRRSLVGYSPWGREESHTTERLHFHFSLSCIGEGNGNPLQCSCLENPRDGGAWWAAVYGVAQSRTQLKRLSSSSRRRQWHPTPVLLPGESQGRRSLVGCSLWGCEESDRLSDFTSTFYFYALEKEMATHYSVLAGESQGQRSLVGCRLWGRTEPDTTEAT